MGIQQKAASHVSNLRESHGCLVIFRSSMSEKARTPVRQVGQPAVHGPTPCGTMTIKVDFYSGWAPVKQDWKFYAWPAWRSK